MRAFLYLKAMHFPARRFTRGPMGYGRIVSAVAILMTASCSYCDNRVDRVDVIPGTVTAAAGKPFLMSVRVMNRVGHLMSEEKAAEVQWKPSNGSLLTISPSQGAQTLATLSSSATGPITLTASVDGKSGSATITPANPGLSLVMDWATSNHIDKERPTLVLVDGQTSSEWRSDTLVAFVGAGPLDKFLPSIDAGEVTVFSPGHALQRMNVGWSDDCDHVRMTEGGAAYPGEIAIPSCRESGMSLAKAKSIPIHIWTLVAAANPASVVEVHLSDARRKLANGWTGLTLDLELPGIEVLPEKPLVLDLSPALGYRCPTSGAYSLPDQLNSAGVGYGPGRLTVVYAQAIVEPSGGLLVPADLAGYACPRDDILGTVVVISWEKGGGSTLAHELGHAIGPPLAHTNGVIGLDDSNLMWLYDAAVPGSRELLTLGQAFRLTLDGASFVYQPPHPNPSCAEQNEGAQTPCPRLSKDMINK